eukprot:COSAG01_NODE_559_length_15469_cov_11.071308_11_plen_46_part_00
MVVSRHRKLLARLRCLAYVFFEFTFVSLRIASRRPSRCSVVATVP